MHDSTSSAHRSATAPRRSLSRRWIPAAIIAPVVVIAAAVAVPLSAGAAPSLPERSAAQILASIADSSGVPFSGTVVQSSSLGLPELPTSGSGGTSTDGVAGALEFLTGSHELRVFVGGTDTSRVQVLDTFAERNVIRNGAEVWTYDSEADEATHLTLPDRAFSSPASTPAELAERLIAASDESSEITVDENARVAGRAAYRITISPDTSDTLVGSATVAVDAETGLPLSVQIEARDQDEPAVEVAFTSIDFSEPDADLFDFSPPAGTAVEEIALAEHTTGAGRTAGADADLAAPTVTSEGWTTIVELPAAEWAAQAEAAKAGAGSADGSPAPSEATDLLDQLTTPVAGGRALETSLVSVLLTDDGRVLVGSVPVDVLVAAAAE